MIYTLIIIIIKFQIYFIIICFFPNIFKFSIHFKYLHICCLFYLFFIFLNIFLYFYWIWCLYSLRPIFRYRNELTNPDLIRTVLSLCKDIAVSSLHAWLRSWFLRACLFWLICQTSINLWFNILSHTSSSLNSFFLQFLLWHTYWSPFFNNITTTTNNSSINTHLRAFSHSIRINKWINTLFIPQVWILKVLLV